MISKFPNIVAGDQQHIQTLPIVAKKCFSINKGRLHIIPINAIESSTILDILISLFIVGLNWIKLVIFFVSAPVMIDSFLKIVSILVHASPPDDHFYKVWIIPSNILTSVPIIRREIKRRFEIDVVKIDWIINIKFRFDRESCNCGVMSLLQLDEFQ